ncbi:hypothetical protein HK105_200381 [Polyrhizophydium stewartii]|uniref:C2H2-type domain-containing protein n=1 Tax=Polyrhizophydium stewartii TaxID=2732419 RepID=A0ABR4NLA0_9FUNG
MHTPLESRPWGCPACGKRFGRADALKRHRASRSKLHACPGLAAADDLRDLDPAAAPQSPERPHASRQRQQRRALDPFFVRPDQLHGSVPQIESAFHDDRLPMLNYEPAPDSGLVASSAHLMHHPLDPALLIDHHHHQQQQHQHHYQQQYQQQYPYHHQQLSPFSAAAVATNATDSSSDFEDLPYSQHDAAAAAGFYLPAAQMLSPMHAPPLAQIHQAPMQSYFALPNTSGEPLMQAILMPIAANMGGGPNGGRTPDVLDPFEPMRTRPLF